MKIIKRGASLLLGAGLLLTGALFWNVPQAVCAETQNPVVDRSFTFGADMAEKAFVFYGDSITERLYLHAGEKDYMQILQEEFSFNYYNGGICGATWTVKGADGKNIFEEIEKSSIMCREADYVGIFLGTNDYGNQRMLGTMQDTAQTESVYGAIKKALDTVIQLNPDVKIMLITPLWREGGYEKACSAGYTLGDVYEAIVAVGKEYGCKIVETKDVCTPENANELMVTDKLHLKEAGYRALAEKIKA